MSIPTDPADGASPVAPTPAAPPARPRVVLVGPPGAGKSTVAALVAQRLGEPLLDTDAVLAERSGQSVGELFVDVGEERFRELEDDVVAGVFARPGVVALGSGALNHGGALLERYAAAGGTVVFLDVSLAAGAPRVGLNVPRPVTLGSPRAQFSSMAARRRPAYAAQASAVIDTSDLSPAQVADAVVAALPRR